MSEPRQPYYWTPSALRVKRAFDDMVKGQGNVRLLLLVSDFGNGKTCLLDQLEREYQWPFPPDYYVRRVHDVKYRNENGIKLRPPKVLDFFEQMGLVPEALRRDAQDYIYHMIRGEDEEDACLTGSDALTFLDWIILRTNAPEPDPLSLMPLLGLREQPTHRCPIRITGEIGDRPASIVTKLLRVIEPQSASRLRSYRSIRVLDIFKGFPAVLLVDEADILSVPCLEEIRYLSDVPRTPVVLAGTQTLISRLEASRSLRALATRAGARVTLEPVSVADLRGACPDMRNEILLEVWKASKRNFRVAMLIVGILRIMQETYPGRTITRKAVMRAAEEVLAADAARVGRGLAGDEDAVSDVEVPDGAESGEERPAEAVAMQAAGRRR